jgi:hypothetical protein
MSASTAEQPIGEIAELTGDLLFKIVEGYGPKGFIFPKYVMTNHGYPLLTHDGPDIIIKRHSLNVTIPLADEEGIYEVGNGSRYKPSDKLVFDNGKVYFNNLDPENQLLYYIPFDQSTNVDRFTRNQLKKIEEKFNRYLRKRKSGLISNTNTQPDDTGNRRKVTVLRPLTSSRYASSEPRGGRKTRRSKKSKKRKIYKRKTNKRKINKKKSRKSKK